MQQRSLSRMHILVQRWGRTCGSCTSFRHVHSDASPSTIYNKDRELRTDKQLDLIVHQFQNTFLKIRDGKKGCVRANKYRNNKYNSSFDKESLTDINKNENIIDCDSNTTCNNNNTDLRSLNVFAVEKESAKLSAQIEKNTSLNNTKGIDQFDKMNSKTSESSTMGNKSADVNFMAFKSNLEQPKILSSKELFLLNDLVRSAQQTKELKEVENCVRENIQPPFAVLQRLCARTSKSNQVGVIHKLQELAQEMYPEESVQHMGFKYYLASALCYAGDVKGSLEQLSQLYFSHPRGLKKVKDTTTFVIYHVLSSNNEEHEQLVLKFVNNLAEELGWLAPALSLWSISFSSSLYRLQMMSEELLEKHPGLIKMLQRKLDGMVQRATWDGDTDLLYRILQLMLHFQLSKSYSPVTSILLKLQCDMGNLSGAEETIKFARHMDVQLTASAVQRFLALLNYHKRPAPLFLLSLKYGHPPAKPSISKPPKYTYKF
nr:uncharacterized protein LOC128699986 [Cherax quadricarinatus]XP_053648826.1 uncharacterized protein LOC128699986 [Cherax quadricarinatus]XP_053648827.1 uncharacterized protein LOC128699986 [Cherax quadricarinatus]XP_053648828.1 uncharacterized protein LOC128699986 [Cherax quadricarinatus]XP_053648829.1 uncharacterized protein LOC128699986 [Cherax quadricarinatus]